ncbi:hypothetical protein [Paenibacillus bovis]|uniref:Uncharacterized protein n=1 Tax=Paenibacillus bovis TaxID=1616788 RepID=A0A172ZDR9_9BACL|nr:hypothetical protein [Paenibacillus bovis]ANF95290.1 hypothetical protein AR543_04175 [Paenibacillus bovis]
MKPRQILIYGLLSFLIASSMALYVYLDHRIMPQGSTDGGIQQLRIQNLDDLQQLMLDKSDQSPTSEAHSL